MNIGSKHLFYLYILISVQIQESIDSPNMVFRLHLIRHAEGTHNPNHDTTIPDPPLTETGIRQSKNLRDDFPYHANVGLVITSPLRRTLQTALLGFSSCLDGKYYNRPTSTEPNPSESTNAQLSLQPEVQAHSSRPCDTGSVPEILQSEFPDLPWSEIDLDIFPAKEGKFAPDAESLEQRGKRIQEILLREFRRLKGNGTSGRGDIVVVSHGGFLRYISGYREGIPAAKWRSFFVEFDAEGKIVARPVQVEELVAIL